MSCGSCGRLLPPGVAGCPFCGASALRSLPGEVAYFEFSARPLPVPPPYLSPVPQPSYQKPAPSQVVPPSFPSRVAFKNRRKLYIWTCVVLSLLLVGIVGGGSYYSYATISSRPSEIMALYQRVTSSQPVYIDHLSSKYIGYWSTTEDGYCQRNEDAYHVKVSEANYYYSCLNENYFGNFALQIHMNIISGDEGGIMFRAVYSSEIFQSYYGLLLSHDGTYRLVVNDKSKLSHPMDLAKGMMQSFHTGYNQSNEITLIAQDNKLYFYVNQQFLFSVIDSTLDGGILGLLALDNTQQTEVAYSEAKIWTL